MANRSGTTTGERGGSTNVPLIILGVLAAAGTVVILIMGSRESSMASAARGESPRRARAKS